MLLATCVARALRTRPASLQLLRSLASPAAADVMGGTETVAKKARIEYANTRENFLSVYNVLRDELLNEKLLGTPPAHALDWLKEMLDYNVPGGKLNRGMAVYDVLAAIKGPENVSESDCFKANVLGWCIEWLQAFFLVADDIMDGSITRRGQPCWYKQNKVGMIACNDYILLECCIYSIINKHFTGHSSELGIHKLFHEITFKTAHGQLLDLITAPIGNVDLSKYTLDTYYQIVTYKTAYYTFYLPVACAMLLAGITDQEAYKVAEPILVEMGQYFQIQDDYLDCYGDPEVIGKIGTDIEDSKCSWLICTALQQATDVQKEKIKEHYGRKDATSVAVIKSVYKELELEAAFKTYEDKSYKELCDKIDAQKVLPAAVFTSLLKKIYKRSK